MGATCDVSSHEQRIREVARAYEQRGYRVTVEPSERDLPEFLKGYAPDLIAEGPDGSVVVEVKSYDGHQRRDDWGRLAAVLKERPGWHLELILGNGDANLALPTMSIAEIRSLLDLGEQLAETGLLDASLLVASSGVEGAMRIAAAAQEVELPDARPATLVSRLYSDGLLDRTDYDFLLSSLRARDAIVHGFRPHFMGRGDIGRLHEVALHLLEECGLSSDSHS